MPQEGPHTAITELRTARPIDLPLPASVVAVLSYSSTCFCPHLPLSYLPHPLLPRPFCPCDRGVGCAVASLPPAMMAHPLTGSASPPPSSAQRLYTTKQVSGVATTGAPSDADDELLIRLPKVTLTCSWRQVQRYGEAVRTARLPLARTGVPTDTSPRPAWTSDMQRCLKRYREAAAAGKQEEDDDSASELLQLLHDDFARVSCESRSFHLLRAWATTLGLAVLRQHERACQEWYARMYRGEGYYTFRLFISTVCMLHSAESTELLLQFLHKPYFHLTHLRVVSVQLCSDVRLQRCFQQAKHVSDTLQLGRKLTQEQFERVRQQVGLLTDAELQLQEQQPRTPLSAHGAVDVDAHRDPIPTGIEHGTVEAASMATNSKTATAAAANGPPHPRPLPAASSTPPSPSSQISGLGVLGAVGDAGDEFCFRLSTVTLRCSWSQVQRYAEAVRKASPLFHDMSSGSRLLPAWSDEMQACMLSAAAAEQDAAERLVRLLHDDYVRVGARSHHLHLLRAWATLLAVASLRHSPARQLAVYQRFYEHEHQRSPRFLVCVASMLTSAVSTDMLLGYMQQPYFHIRHLRCINLQLGSDAERLQRCFHTAKRMADALQDGRLQLSSEQFDRVRWQVGLTTEAEAGHLRQRQPQREQSPHRVLEPLAPSFTAPAAVDAVEGGWDGQGPLVAPTLQPWNAAEAAAAAADIQHHRVDAQQGGGAHAPAGGRALAQEDRDNPAVRSATGAASTAATSAAVKAPYALPQPLAASQSPSPPQPPSWPHQPLPVEQAEGMGRELSAPFPAMPRRSARTAVADVRKRWRDEREPEGAAASPSPRLHRRRVKQRHDSRTSSEGAVEQLEEELSRRMPHSWFTLPRADRLRMTATMTAMLQARMSDMLTAMTSALMQDGQDRRSSKERGIERGGDVHRRSAQQAVGETEEEEEGEEGGESEGQQGEASDSAGEEDAELAEASPRAGDETDEDDADDCYATSSGVESDSQSLSTVQDELTTRHRR